VQLLPQSEDLQILRVIGLMQECEEIEDQGEELSQGAIEHAAFLRTR
jgi:hypothetical protein